MNMNLTVNGVRQEWDVRPNESLLDALRRNGYTGAKRVCESGECGACAVIVDGLAIDSCMQLALQATGSEIITVEGLAVDEALTPIQEAFADNGSIQCGFCIPGMIVTATNYLEQNPQADEQDVRHVFVGNLCRCTGYKKPVEAVLRAARGERR
jgi:carbon-monoxide dehydrogenase small subunit